MWPEMFVALGDMKGRFACMALVYNLSELLLLAALGKIERQRSYCSLDLGTMPTKKNVN